MRGSDERSGSVFSYVDIESRAPAKHTLRTIKGIVDDVLVPLDAKFDRLCEGTGRQSIAPERLLRASLLQAFYSVRSERQLMEQIDYNLLFRWFVGLGIDDAVWDHSTFSKNRDRLLDADVAAKFLEAVLRHPRVKLLRCGSARMSPQKPTPWKMQSVSRATTGKRKGAVCFSTTCGSAYDRSRCSGSARATSITDGGSVSGDRKLKESTPRLAPGRP
jgi:transposase